MNLYSVGILGIKVRSEVLSASIPRELLHDT